MHRYYIWAVHNTHDEQIGAHELSCTPTLVGSTPGQTAGFDETLDAVTLELSIALSAVPSLTRSGWFRPLTLQLCSSMAS
jgi:hypothetical protein